MQEEVESRTTNLVVSVTKLTARAIYSAYVKHTQKSQRKKDYLKTQMRIKKEKAAAKKQAARAAPPRGRQTVKQLVGQGQGVSSMEVSNKDLKGFERVARKYGVDYAIRKDMSKDPPRYLVFFKARDADALSAALKEYMASVMKKQHQKKPSVLKQLRRLVAIARSTPQKVRKREQERDR